MRATGIKDHPRLRGTNNLLSDFYCLIVGSPPLARDKYAKALEGVTDEGITPACAGQIVDATNRYILNWDHPRLRGTNQERQKIKQRR